jgi:diguanylate cyclase (GGDEF)-like protein
MAVRRYPVAIGFVAVVATLVAVNATEPFGERFALWVDNALQLSMGFTAAGCGFVMARRYRGPQRWWRLLIAFGMAGWSGGQLVWSWYQLIENRGLPSPSLADVGYLLLPVFALPALLVLATARERSQLPNQRTAHFGLAVVLDGLVVSGSLFILAWEAALGPVVRARPPDALTWAVAIAYPTTDLVMVAVAVLLVVFDRFDRRYRANLLLLAVGVVALACSDSIFVYLVSIGAESMKPLADAGFVLGPLFIGYALVAAPAQGQPETADHLDTVDWWQLVLPYLPVMAVGVLFTVQLISGGHPDAVAAGLGVVMVLVVVARQVTYLLDNRLLLSRVYDAQRQLTHQAFHDALTGLANRALFAEKLNRAISDRARQRLVLIFVDLDDFKEVNDRFGHAAGDRLLHAVGQRLSGCLRSTDTVARLGGDEFAILLNDEVDAPQVIADRLRSALRQPFEVHGTLVTVRASMGLVVLDPTEVLPPADVLLGQADASMYEGKRLGKDTAVVYRVRPGAPPDFASTLRGCPGEVPDGFRLVYQPIVRLADATPVAVEALARWTAPDGTVVSPETFVHAAEHAGLGATLDAMVLDLACREITQAGLDLAVHVNIGAGRLGDAAFENSIRTALERYPLARGQLVVEITETAPVVDLDGGAAAIRRLRSLGVRVALDDIGTGYNSLAYLHALPVDVIKLDRALTTGNDPERDAALCRSLVRLCDDLGLAVVAEGIETAAQAEKIAQAGCTLAQGYRFGYPGPLADLSTTREAALGP